MQVGDRVKLKTPLSEDIKEHCRNTLSRTFVNALLNEGEGTVIHIIEETKMSLERLLIQTHLGYTGLLQPKWCELLERASAPKEEPRGPRPCIRYLRIIP